MFKHLSLLLCLVFGSVQAQTLEWPESSIDIYTESNATYLIQSVTLDNSPILFGYNLGAYYVNDDGELSCGGFCTWNGSQTAMAVYGDDSTTPEKDGFAPGEQINWYAYGSFLEETYAASINLMQGTENFGVNTINIVSSYMLDSLLAAPIQGCMDISACNYDSEAVLDDSSCEYALDLYNCDGTCIDTDQDGICDIDETSGCMDNTACNYISTATDDDGTCTYADEGYDCNGDCIDTDEDEVCDFNEIPGCTNDQYFEYDPLATDDNGSCVSLIISGCSDSTSFNFDNTVNLDDGSCINNLTISFEETISNTTQSYNVSGDEFSLLLGAEDIVEGDLIGAFYITDNQLYCAGYSAWVDGDFSIPLWTDDPNTEEIEGYIIDQPIYWIIQQSATLYHYVVNVTSVEVESIVFITDITLNTDLSVGCTDGTAYNFNPLASIDDNSCVPYIYGCTDEDACNYDTNANTDDGSCYNLTMEVLEYTASQPLTITTNAEGPTYSWYLNGEILSETSSSYTPYMNGTYTIMVTDETGCTIESSVEVTTVSLDEKSIESLQIYPIPVNNELFIDANTKTINKVQLFDLKGRLLYYSVPQTSKMTIQRADIRNGYYLLEIIVDGKKINKPILF